MTRLSEILKRCRRELAFDYIRAAGPGGQNVNKVATAVQLRFDVRNSQALPEAARAPLTRLGGRRMTNQGMLIIEARRYRTQDQNREDAFARFAALVEKSLEKPKLRKKTRPGKVAREKRLESKKKRADVKRERRSKSFD